MSLNLSSDAEAHPHLAAVRGTCHKRATKLPLAPFFLGLAQQGNGSHDPQPHIGGLDAPTTTDARFAGCRSWVRWRAITGKSLDEIRSTLQGKDAKAVMSLMGKPLMVVEFGGVGGVDERWSYFQAARHPATGTKTDVSVCFRGGRVVKIEGF